MEEQIKPLKNRNLVDPVTDEEERSLRSLLRATNGKSLFPERTAAAKKIAENILLDIKEGRIPKDFFPRKK